jgi:hypothetical protein
LPGLIEKVPKTCGEAFFVDKVIALNSLNMRFIVNLSLKMTGTYRVVSVKRLTFLSNIILNKTLLYKYNHLAVLRIGFPKCYTTWKVIDFAG